MARLQRPRVNIITSIRQKLGTLGLSREGIVKTLFTLHDELPILSPQSREDRYEDDPTCFVYAPIIIDAGRVWTLQFVVLDAEWPNQL